MNTITRWVLPCYFSEENYKTDPITFDLTNHLKTILSNEVWNRKFHYGFSSALQKTELQHINKASVTIFPKFISGLVNENRITELIENTCGKIPSHFNVQSYKQWSHLGGLAILETEYSYRTSSIPSKRDLKDEFMPHYELDFIELYDRHLAVLKELSAFFLSVIHLTFPSTSVIMRDNTPLNDGLLHIKSGRKIYCSRVATNAYMHEVLLESKQLQNVRSNMQAIAPIWHYNLWPLKRYLTAVESDQLSMDNLLDLIYALEGLFEKNASADFIKTMCISVMCKSRKDAKSRMNLLDTAYKIRNDIAHGERSYDIFDHVKLAGKEILAQDIYWEMKSIVSTMIVTAMSKLISNKDMRNLRFVDDDLINKIFKT